MNSVFTMKLVSFFARLALTGVAAFVLALAFDVQPLALFSFAIGALVLLVVADDYAPRHRNRVMNRSNVIAFTPAPVHGAAPAKLVA